MGYRSGEPWFLAKDVCAVLDIQNSTQAIQNAGLDEDEFSMFSIENSESGTKGRPPLIISESGLYGLLASSRKPVAKQFNRWVRKVVLPQIRKTGGFGTDPVVANTLQKLLDEMSGRNRRLEAVEEQLADQRRPSMTAMKYVIANPEAKCVESSGVEITECD